MKTAMQELIEEIQYWKEKAPLGSAFKDCLIILEGSATNSLEKEKEQIIDAFEQGLEFSFPTNGSNYFNKTYNQNKQHIKTAMQEMVEWIEEKFNNPKETETFKKATELLEKEKEQHKETWFRSTAQFDNAAEMTYKKLFDEYYQETYNQNK